MTIGASSVVINQFILFSVIISQPSVVDNQEKNIITRITALTPSSLRTSFRHCIAGSSSFRREYLRETEPMIVLIPKGIAIVRKALSSGLLTGEPSGFFEGSIAVKLLNPTEMFTPARSLS